MYVQHWINKNFFHVVVLILILRTKLVFSHFILNAFYKLFGKLKLLALNINCIILYLQCLKIS